MGEKMNYIFMPGKVVSFQFQKGCLLAIYTCKRFLIPTYSNCVVSYDKYIKNGCSRFPVGFAMDAVFCELFTLPWDEYSVKPITFWSYTRKGINSLQTPPALWL